MFIRDENSLAFNDLTNHVPTLAINRQNHIEIVMFNNSKKTPQNMCIL